MKTISCLIIWWLVLPATGFYLCAQERRAPLRQVAVTFDDLPFTGDRGRTDVNALRAFTAKLLDTIKSHRIPAIGFVNERKLQRAGEQEARTAVLKMWTDAGLELGNHTFAHADFDRTPLAAFQQQVIDGEPVTRSLLAARGMKLRYFAILTCTPGLIAKLKKRSSNFSRRAATASRPSRLTIWSGSLRKPTPMPCSAATGDDAARGR
jgi:peptidoglycan/xylan/chitin deacetylase (PgdA/CDA1 family)